MFIFYWFLTVPEGKIKGNFKLLDSSNVMNLPGEASNISESAFFFCKNIVVSPSRAVAIESALWLFSPRLAIVDEHLTRQLPRSWLTSLAIQVKFYFRICYFYLVLKRNDGSECILWDYKIAFYLLLQIVFLSRDHWHSQIIAYVGLSFKTNILCYFAHSCTRLSYLSFLVHRTDQNDLTRDCWNQRAVLPIWCFRDARWHSGLMLTLLD